MSNQPIVCMNVLCKVFKQKQWNTNFKDNGEVAPWDDYLCPECGGRTEPFWIIEYHYKIPGVKELEEKILECDAKIKQLRKANSDLLPD